MVTPENRESMCTANRDPCLSAQRPLFTRNGTPVHNTQRPCLRAQRSLMLDRTGQIYQVHGIRGPVCDRQGPCARHQTPLIAPSGASVASSGVPLTAVLCLFYILRCSPKRCIVQCSACSSLLCRRSPQCHGGLAPVALTGRGTALWWASAARSVGAATYLRGNHGVL